MSDNATVAAEIKQELASTWEKTKEVLDRQDGELAKLGEATGETKATFDRLNAKIDELETKLTRPGGGAPDHSDEDAERVEYAKAFWNGMRRGKGRLEPDAAKALSSGIGTAGGFLVPEQWSNELLRNVIEFSPVREFATVTSISVGDALNIPKKTGEPAGGWVAELGTRSESTNQTYGNERISVHEGYLLIDVSKQLLEDAAYNFESELSADFAEQQAVLEGAAHINGTAVGQPEGLLTNADVSYTASGTASQVTADGMIAITHDIKSAYTKDAVWLMERATLKTVRQFKDGNGQYLWTPGFGTTMAGDLAPTILGRPYRTAEDMPSIGSNTFPILYGSLKAAYRIVDRVDLEIVRDELTQAATGKVRFTGRFRTGGQVVLAEAVRKLKCAAS